MMMPPKKFSYVFFFCVFIRFIGRSCDIQKVCLLQESLIYCIMEISLQSNLAPTCLAKCLTSRKINIPPGSQLTLIITSLGQTSYSIHCSPGGQVELVIPIILRCLQHYQK